MAGQNGLTVMSTTEIVGPKKYGWPEWLHLEEPRQNCRAEIAELTRQQEKQRMDLERAAVRNRWSHAHSSRDDDPTQKGEL